MNACNTKNVEDLFSLSRGGSQLVSAEAAQNLWLSLAGYSLEAGLAKNSLLAKGTLLARNQKQHLGNLHSPIDGFIVDIAAEGLLLSSGLPKVKEGETVEPLPPVAPVDVLHIEQEKLATSLVELGLDSIDPACSFDKIIINALNPEPGIFWAQPILDTERETVKAAVLVLKKLYPHASFSMAYAAGHLGEHTKFYTELGIALHEIQAIYPQSLNELVAKAVTGQELPEDVAVIGLHTIWSYGRVAQSGMPLTETLLCAGETMLVAPVGLSAQQVMAQTGLSIQAGDSLIFGGPMRGVAQTRPQAGLGKHTYGLFVLPAHAVPLMEGDDACINCGDCLPVCPARLQPNRITRSAEFGLFEQCDTLYVQSCFECGMCGYVCRARRPMLQYIRLAKSQSQQQPSSFATRCL